MTSGALLDNCSIINDANGGPERVAICRSDIYLTNLIIQT